MATDFPTPNPAPPQPVPGPAPSIDSAPNPDLQSGLSALSSPTNQPSVAGTTEVQQAQSYEQQAQAAAQRANQLANAPVIPPDAPHARLLQMVTSLATGLSALGTSIATKGAQGGAAEVAQIQGEQQRQKLEAQQAAMAQRNQQIQQQLAVADTNHKMGQNILLMATMPLEIEAKDLAVQSQQQALEAGKVSLAGQRFDLFANTGMNTDQINNLVSGGAVDAKTSSVLQANAQQQLRLASQLLPADNPSLTAMKDVLDKNASAADLVLASKRLQSEVTGQEKITAAQSAKNTAEANSPVAKLGTPEALAAPGAQAAIQAKIDDPTTDPNDVPRLRALLPQAAVAQFNAENIKQREARNTQILSQGDPDRAGQLLANRSLTLDELKSRQVTPQFITAAIQAAQKYDPNFKAAESAAQAKIAASPANSQFFGNTDSLLVRGGTLDQLQRVGDSLGNTKLPAFNSLENWTKASLGSGPQAAFAAAALGVADDYSKVMTGGVGSDASRLEALKIISRDLSPAGRAASINQIRNSVSSQRQGRVGQNPYLRDMYPDPAVTRTETPQVGQAHPVIINGQQVGVTRDGGKTMTAN